MKSFKALVKARARKSAQGPQSHRLGSSAAAGLGAAGPATLASLSCQPG